MLVYVTLENTISQHLNAIYTKCIAFDDMYAPPSLGRIQLENDTVLITKENAFCIFEWHESVILIKKNAIGV